MKRRNLGEVIPREHEAERAWIIEVGVQGDDLTTTYAQLQREADELAAGLRRKGLARGTRVGILAANGSRYYTAFLATMRAGLVSVPINFKLTRDTIDYIVGDAGIELMLVDAEREALVSGVPAIRLDDDQSWAAARSAETSAISDSMITCAGRTSSLSTSPRASPELW
jgi:acyl-CoA synthetase (AMP-forming)/AMP-acid ligase II